MIGAGTANAEKNFKKITGMTTPQKKKKRGVQATAQPVSLNMARPMDPRKRPKKKQKQ